MKAYEVFLDNCESFNVVFAKTAREARIKAYRGDTVFSESEDCFSDIAREYIYIQVDRLPLLDGLEQVSPIKLAEMLILQCCWHWNFEDGTYMDEDNFDREKFEELWKQ